MEKQVFEIDGERFSDLEGFFAEISKIVGDGWGKNLDSLADILLGAMGTPFDEPFILIWKHSALSRERLGYEATQKLREDGFRNYSRGLNYDEFTRYMRRHIWRQMLIYGKKAFEGELERAQEGYRYYEQQIELAHQREGGTIFDWIMACFRDVPDIEVKLE